MTSLPASTFADSAKLDAFWGEDDYYLRAEGEQGVQWYRFDGLTTESASQHTMPTEQSARLAIGALMADVIPLGTGRVAFPVGSTGRTVFRVWRGKGESLRPARTRILAVRAARSRRLPA